MIDDKPSLEEALEHYGVLGMRWGVRTRTRSAYGEAKAKERQRKAARRPDRVVGRQITSFASDPRSAVTVAGIIAVGVAYSQSPHAQAAMRASMSNVGKVASNKTAQRAVVKVLKGAGKVYIRAR